MTTNAEDRKQLDYAVFSERSDTKTALRAWQPGDGLRCSKQRADSRIPCGRPVAVVITRYDEGKRYERTIRRLACANHIPGLSKLPHQVNLEATKAATERLIAEHWDEYQGYLKSETEQRLAEVFEFADDSIRQLVLDTYEGNTAS